MVSAPEPHPEAERSHPQRAWPPEGEGARGHTAGVCGLPAGPQVAEQWIPYPRRYAVRVSEGPAPGRGLVFCTLVHGLMGAIGHSAWETLTLSKADGRGPACRALQSSCCPALLSLPAERSSGPGRSPAASRLFTCAPVALPRARGTDAGECEGKRRPVEPPGWVWRYLASV